MVTTVSRVLAVLLAVLLAFGQSLTEQQEPPPRPEPTPSTVVATAKPWPHAVVKPATNSTTIALVLAYGQHKQSAPPRDLPDGYVPFPVAVPAPGDAWRFSPRTSGPGLLPDTHVDLPWGRAPPFTALS